MVKVKIPDDLIIAIDGHSSGGKSTFARAIAKELELFISTAAPCTGRLPYFALNKD